MVSGLSLSAYWVSNMLTDIFKAYVPIVLIIGLSVLFGCDYPGIWVIFLVLPWGLIPFTYLTSFLFDTDTNAQVATLVLNFLICVVLASTVHIL
jgi:ATP-binding cassette subfamily A (ABC1) protein 3